MIFPSRYFEKLAKLENSTSIYKNNEEKDETIKLNLVNLSFLTLSFFIYIKKKQFQENPSQNSQVEKQKLKIRPSLIWCMLKVFPKRIIIGGIFNLTRDLLMFFGPYILGFI